MWGTLVATEEIKVNFKSVTDISEDATEENMNGRVVIQLIFYLGHL